MKRLTPTPFVNISYEIIESVDKSRDILGSIDFFGAAEEGPVLFVLVLNFLFSNRAAGEFDGAFTLLLGGAKDANKPVDAAGDKGSGDKESERIH